MLGNFFATSVSYLVVIDDLDITRVSTLPDETDSPLIVYANTMLSLAVSREFLQPI
jgi:hypothetical protein